MAAHAPLPSTAPLGFRKGGRPIYPILGVSADDPSNGGIGGPGEGAGGTPVSVPQSELSRLFAREKDQGLRAGVRDLVASRKALTDFVQAQHDAEQERKAAEQARLSEVERREQAATERERQARERESAAALRERDAARRAVLVNLGAAGDGLEDAVALLTRDIEPDADDTTLTQAADTLKRRRPELFAQGQGRGRSPEGPLSGAPSGVPGRGGGPPPHPGQRGLDFARRRGPLPPS
ncbi:hypothetical protein AB0E75_08155 [Streptomyces griseoviridis]|uniref:Uncharacterized protein n=1 Tax=Streptomyces griseoviridis TaxID=45398 RepID=A0A918GD44_STRGD|nr:hypothetical protein [Streptomyces niveoruber]GGS29761.1 hypothetical protein GCM10010238_18360 [Streptomyces niveoruber]